MEKTDTIPGLRLADFLTGKMREMAARFLADSSWPPSLLSSLLISAAEDLVGVDFFRLLGDLR